MLNQFDNVMAIHLQEPSTVPSYPFPLILILQQELIILCIIFFFFFFGIIGSESEIVLAFVMLLQNFCC